MLKTPLHLPLESYHPMGFERIAPPAMKCGGLMLKKIYRFLILLSIFILAVTKALAATPAQVDYDGERISVLADGVSLGQLLPLVQKQTGVHFYWNRLLSDETIVYVNFKNSDLSDGIKRILSKFNHAMLYDGSSRICTVFVFDRQLALSKDSTNHRAQYETQDDTFMALNETEKSEAFQNDTFMAPNETEENEALSDEIPDQGPEGLRPPPWVNVNEPPSPQGLPPDSGNELASSLEDLTAETNNSQQNKKQPQSPSMDSDVEDISPSEPQE